MQIHPLLFRRLLGLLLLGVIVAVATVHGAAIDARSGVSTSACADDLHAYSLVEYADAPTAWLTNAGLAFMKARESCASGEGKKAPALHQSMDGDKSLPDPDMTK